MAETVLSRNVRLTFGEQHFPETNSLITTRGSVSRATMLRRMLDHMTHVTITRTNQQQGTSQ